MLFKSNVDIYALFLNILIFSIASIFHIDIRFYYKFNTNRKFNSFFNYIMSKIIFLLIRNKVRMRLIEFSYNIKKSKQITLD